MLLNKLARTSILLRRCSPTERHLSTLFNIPALGTNKILKAQLNAHLLLENNGSISKCNPLVNDGRPNRGSISRLSTDSDLIPQEVASVLVEFYKKRPKSRRPNMSEPSQHEIELRKKYQPRNIQFRTPYGQIACLEWGKKEAPKKIFCIHGWLDNAGSFERLIPFILDHADNAREYHVVAIDTPGVGLSSHVPSGSNYTNMFFVKEIRRVIQQLGWDKLTFLSHSLGAHHSFLYCCLYPDQIENFISIDLPLPVARPSFRWHSPLASSIDEHFKTEYHHEDDPTTNIQVPVYSETDALKRLMDAHSSAIDLESAKVLLKRGARKQRWGYTFNRDVRLRHIFLEILPDDETMLQYIAGPFRPNLLLIRAMRSPYQRPDTTRLKYYEVYEKNCKTFRDVSLDGTHHIHLNQPKLVADEVVKFLDDLRKSDANGNDGCKVDTALGEGLSKSNL